MFEVSMPYQAILDDPYIRKHIDGPILCWAGRMHWLTLRERLLLWLGLSSAFSVADQVWPDMMELKKMVFREKIKDLRNSLSCIKN